MQELPAPADLGEFAGQASVCLPWRAACAAALGNGAAAHCRFPALNAGFCACEVPGWMLCGFVPRVLRDQGVGLFRAEERVFEAMVDGWRTPDAGPWLGDGDH
jgi:hypothetical protein